MSIVYNRKKASDLVVNGNHIREAWIDGKKVWPEITDWGDWFVVRYKAVSKVTIHIRQAAGKICEVDWDDGKIEQFSNLSDDYNSNIRHSYASVGSRTVKLRGDFIGVSFNHDAGYSFKELEAVLNVPNTFKPQNASYMFLNCSSLKTIPWMDFSENKNLIDTFRGCVSLLEIPAMDFSKALYVEGTFAYCQYLIELPVLDFSSCYSLNEVFKGCTLLKTIKMITRNSFDLNGLNVFSETFKDCENLEYIDARLNCNTRVGIGSLVNANSTFENCYQLKNIPFGDMTGIHSFKNCFKNCKSLYNIELKLENARRFENMFEGCGYLIKVTLDMTFKRVPGYTQFNKYYVSSMFKDCVMLTHLSATTHDGGSDRNGIDPTDYEEKPIDRSYYPFERCRCLSREEIPETMRWMYDDYYKEV